MSDPQTDERIRVVLQDPEPVFLEAFDDEWGRRIEIWGAEWRLSGEEPHE